MPTFVPVQGKMCQPLGKYLGRWSKDGKTYIVDFYGEGCEVHIFTPFNGIK